MRKPLARDRAASSRTRDAVDAESLPAAKPLLNFDLIEAQAAEE